MAAIFDHQHHSVFLFAARHRMPEQFLAIRSRISVMPNELPAGVSTHEKEQRIEAVQGFRFITLYSGFL